MPGLVLIIEDDTDARSALSAVLNAAGYQVIAAANGREALEALDGPLQPSAIVLDLMMPEMDGWEFLARRRFYGESQDIPVAVVTATSALKPRDADVILQKPLDPIRLISWIENRARGD